MINLDIWFPMSVSRSMHLLILLKYLVMCHFLLSALSLKYRWGVHFYFLHASHTWVVGYEMMQTAVCESSYLLIGQIRLFVNFYE